MQRVEDSSAVPQQFTGRLADAAAGYAEERHWDVLPGAWLEAGPHGAPRCSCGFAFCPAPGAHPTRPDWAARASGAAPAVRRMWQKQPRASILLPAGRSFDALDVSEEAGCLALARMERMSLAIGPVLGTPRRRLLFFVLPGTGAKVPDLLRRHGWAPQSLDLAVLGEGDWVVAPPTRTVPAGCVQWARRPTLANRWLPDAAELIGALAYACAREAIEAREAAEARAAAGVR
ncbi:bifunctional DNA primase/polymerase [Streptomyces sp. PRB2-1]|uniref:Bifunctional DNA primase/polymerase n=1 Tax=Actinacidiphila epipremni TaxID=2053013 RepID=A0ABX0ZSG5_9ACTN|nr:bifunctional DNA primase/polymerase [Actinacidiphila epipremni]